MGLYIRTLLDGIAPIPEIDPGIRAEVRALSVAEAYLALQQEDSESAARLAPADSSRIARALEVIRSTRKPLGWWHAHIDRKSTRLNSVTNAQLVCRLLLEK